MILSNYIEIAPQETAIFVHGWGNDHYEAKERLDRVKMSLEYNKYYIPLIGLSWNSDTGWDNAKPIAKETGVKLAGFILDYLMTCKQEQNKDVSIRFIAHSQGSRVVLSTLQTLHENSTNNFKIRSVHLMGAAVDDEEVSLSAIDQFNEPGWGQGPLGCFPGHFYTGNGVKFPYGTAISEEVFKFYNLINSEDNVLQFIYPCFEGGDNALGVEGKQKSGISPPHPSIYNEVYVQKEITSYFDADNIEEERLVCSGFACITVEDGWDFGLCNIYGFCRVGDGDNHAGYIGFRSPITHLLADDGAMNVVTKHWSEDG